MVGVIKIIELSYATGPYKMEGKLFFFFSKRRGSVGKVWGEVIKDHGREGKPTEVLKGADSNVGENQRIDGVNKGTRRMCFKELSGVNCWKLG